MMYNQILKAGEPWDIHQAGRSIAIIKAQPGLRVSVFGMGGDKQFESELPQGTSIDVPFKQLQFIADRDMKVTVWAGNFRYGYTEQPSRPNELVGRRLPLYTGVKKLLDYDPPRQRATVRFPMDAWVGGANMQASHGVVDNGRFYPAGSEIEITNYGEFFYYVKEAEGTALYTSSVPMLRARSSSTRTELEAQNTAYIDFEVPEHLHNQTIRLTYRLQYNYQHASGQQIGTRPRLLYTIGGPQTDEMAEIYLYSPGVHGQREYTGSSTVALSAGVHRIFFAETTWGELIDGDSTWGDPSGTTIELLMTDQPLLSVEGYAEVMEERV
ncbi:hypothetical protein [Pseudoalteromonas rubra]|uniref:hypothetical protein n=1 Tax=Pseudoalteromonas rubra TaxID=43658 RepID=UPI002DB6DB1F|nr:hypothetical protein [Pseudoalteromonas rubra]MEC4091151.1 hypothetical protein [Pseudoalteromonas rubra]